MDYYSPEQRSENGKASKASDIFSLGILMHRLLLDELPERKNDIPVLSKGLDKTLKTLFTGMFQRDPEKRPSILDVRKIFMRIK